MIVDQPTLAAEAAVSLTDAALRESHSLGIPLTAAVVDGAAHLLSFVRSIGSPLATIETAQKKAWTAVATRRPTHKWAEIIEDDQPLRLGVVGAIDRVVVFGGGFPIVVDGRLVGGIGISGAHYDIDQRAAESVLSAVGFEVVHDRV